MTFWEPGESAYAHTCFCRCHGTVRMNPLTGFVMAFFNVPPRYDNPMAWAEACEACSFSHEIATSASDQVTQIEATETENLKIFNIHHKRT